ncbi:Putative mannosyl-3-phosphoglycerate phosphatase [Aquimixticola soesokkakensis]|uniref:Putative mannosyl-3-phosphoglycerate phosphatase n=1 Tax=Aquimixticola soesokkakensis TaxID=1519096 RepID=A0A1Y5TP38_9RHOB|nr:HAD-IIB family hydrolase [Aquimixticola soesokkakensis]SLN68763.1 Putative mannosyl-3-phosphoglycerate phosphatase [Aquimixticola soesokkakensis]
MSGFLVFTDLDGTLLDHSTYSYAAARDALRLLHHHGVPLVLASSKTAAEIAPLRAELGYPHVPAIVENGAGILEAHAKAGEDRGDYLEIIAILNALPGRIRACFEGFSDWSVGEIARHTGLPAEEAARAAARQFSEPGIWLGSDEELAAFEAELAKYGLRGRRGGRFYTLSFGATKASRMAEITARARPAPITLALGDAPNDREMIEMADYGVIIKNDHGAELPALDGEAQGRVIRTDLSGPAGWNRAVIDILSPHFGAKT